MDKLDAMTQVAKLLIGEEAMELLSNKYSDDALYIALEAILTLSDHEMLSVNKRDSNQ